MTTANLALLLFAVASAATGQLLLKHGMNTAAHAVAEGCGPLALRAATSPFVIGGLAVFAISALAWLTTLSRVPLSIAYPFNAIGYLVILALSVVVLHEHATVWTVVGTCLVVAGLVVIVTT